MNRLIYSLFFLLFWLPIVGQEGLSQQDLSQARYVFDYRTEIDFQQLIRDSVWNISNIEEEEVINITNTEAKENRIPFYGFVTKNNSGEILQMTVADPLMKYGTRKVFLDRPISTESPEKEVKMTGYSIILVPNDIEQNVLYQLPILPDSIRVLVTAKIKDSDWSDISLNYNSSDLKNRSFVRTMEIDRSVSIKIAPFGWTPVNNVAPMIDWDNSFVVEQRYFIASGLGLPYAIVDKRNDEYNIAILDFEKSKEDGISIIGVPQIKALPNPVINDVRFEISNVPEGMYTIKIKNILGETKVKKEIQLSSSDTFPVNIDSLGKGSYFYVLENDQGNVLSTKRLIVLKP